MATNEKTIYKQIKPWQKGYELDVLLKWVDKFKNFNEYCHNPFLQAKKNSMATLLSLGNLYEENNVAYEMRTAKTSSKINMFNAGPEIGSIIKGEKVISKISVNTKSKNEIVKVLKKIEGPVWCKIFEENTLVKSAVLDSNFKKIGIKVNTFSDVIGIYYKGERTFTPVVDTENINMAKTSLKFDEKIINQLVEELQNLDLKYTNHNSNYNKKQSWQALSILGFEKDSKYVDKKADNTEDRPLVQTDLYDLLEGEKKLLGEFLDKIPGKFDRVRFMTLKPGGGELKRHTDQTDPTWGTTDGKMVRLHIPLKTNENVIFTSWNNNGERKKYNMKKGECWFLDTRRPHTAINNGNDIRIHLVADVWSNDKIRNILRQNETIVSP